MMADTVNLCFLMPKVCIDAQHWLHRLPLDEGAAPHRLGLTFRSIVPGFESHLLAREGASSTQGMDDGIGRDDISADYRADRASADV